MTRKELFVIERTIPHLLLLLLLLVEVFILNVSAEESKFIAKPGCQYRCGDVNIPFPFGIGENCYLSEYFAIDCHSSPDGSKHTPLLSCSSFPLEVLSISVNRGTMRVSQSVFRNCETIFNTSSNNQTANLIGTPFFFSKTANKFTGLGCSTLAYIFLVNNSFPKERSILGGCVSICNSKFNSYSETEYDDSLCSGINCCQTGIPSSLQVFNIAITSNVDLQEGRHTREDKPQQDCRHAFLVEGNWTYDDQDKNLAEFTHLPVVLDWRVEEASYKYLPMNGTQGNYCHNSLYNSSDSAFYTCSCYDYYGGYYNDYYGGYEYYNYFHDYDDVLGNPYLENGCKRDSSICKDYGGRFAFCDHYLHKEKVKMMIKAGIGPSFGGLLLFAMGWWIYIIIKRRKVMKRKKEFFKRNGGLLLEKQLISSGGKVDRCKLFCSEDLEKATDNFSKNRILGQGGQGTVYKGMLADGQIIAVKKSKVIDEVRLEEFVNEFDILSQINHRNVVKLLGCCLETDVPLLVYEFIPNGTLYMYIHNRNEDLEFTWDMRLRIATEVAEALSYLHSAASIPIYHRDIKSTNILLDEMLRAKVADFGTSKSFAMDQTHVTTKVLGTYGYIDPEYFQSNQFTEKSDVYSFGVVLVELLTGENPMRQGKYGTLVSYFSVSVKEDRLNDILDAQVQSSGKKEEIMTIASLAQRCLYLNGKKRPSMKEVAMVLEKTRASQNESKLDEPRCEEIKDVRSEIFESWDMVTSSRTSTFAIAGPSTDDQPLMTS